MSRKKTHDEFLQEIEIFNKKNPNWPIFLLEGEIYNGNNKKMGFRCESGHQWKTLPTQITSRNVGCVKCTRGIKRKNTTLAKYGVEHISQLQAVKNKKKVTTQENYGVSHHMHSDKVKDKIKKTNLELYGVENVLSSEEIKQKIKKTNEEKYGGHPVCNEIVKEKIKKTNIEKYGAESVLLSETIKDKIKKTNIERYGTENVFASSDIKEKIKETNIERYGADHPSKNHDVRQKIIKTSRIKYNRDNFSQISLSEEVLKKLNDKEWLKDQHYNKKKTLYKISKETGVSDGTVGRYLKLHGLCAKSFFVSDAEKEIGEFLKQNINSDIIFNTRNVISPFELDIFIPEYNIAIEYCGLFWHSLKDKYYHRDKMIMCNNKGTRLITIFEDEWENKKDIVKKMLINIIGNDNNSIYGRKCNIVIPDRADVINFFNNTHVQSGNVSYSISIALYYNSIMVAVMTFIKREDEVYELNRFSSSVRVVGGFSKLLKYFIKTYSPREIISFADLRWSNGNLYEKNGFVLDKTLPPSYSYVINKKRYNKRKFRHGKIKNMLEKYDENLSEHQNMDKHDILRIYDCGLNRYVMEIKKGT